METMGYGREFLLKGTGCLGGQLFQLLKVIVCGGQGQIGWVGITPLSLFVQLFLDNY